MTFLRRFGLLALSLAVLASWGCQRSSVISIPPPPPNKLYVNDGSGTIGLQAYTMPLGPASTPAFTLAGSNLIGSGAATDSLGNVYSAHFLAATIDVFNLAVTSTSTPAFTMAVASACGPTTKVSNTSGMSFDHSGNLWVAGEFGNQVYELTPPFAGGCVIPAFFNCACFSGPVTTLFDRAGNLIVPEFGGKAVQIFRQPFAFGPPNVPAATLTVPAAPPFNGPVSIGGAGISVADQLVLGLNDGRIIVYNGPFATGSVPAFQIAAPAGASGVRNMIYDASGNLYVPYALSGQIGVFASPLSAASTPLLLFSAGAGTFPYGMTLAP